NAETGVLTAVATGSGVGITATQAGNYKYLPATLTRQFSVFNKQTPAFATDVHFTGTSGRVEQTCTATITVTGVGADSEEGFTITSGNSTIISVVRDGETITITGLAVGSTTLTLTQAGNDDYLAKTQTYSIEVYWPEDFLTLSPDEAPSYDAGSFRKIFLQRTLKAGYSTLALPFATDVATLTGRAANDDDWVAQLQTVTNSAADGYTLYFRKVDGGTIAANQPYVLHLGTEVVNPTWTDLGDGITVAAASASSVGAQTGYSGYAGWTMYANYAVDFDMEGKYGVVNSVGGLKRGGEGSTLAAFTAYIAPPQANNAPRLRVAYVDPDGTTTVVEGLPSDDSATDPQTPVVIYGPDGKRRPRLQPGLNIVHQADGSVKKVMY
ncbi:MAG: hypothetical protein IJT19_03510, partial [Bacteroidaceae bacterium]|nr:hypothetical protein [Bacteroidaceae bacterium]